MVGASGQVARALGEVLAARGAEVLFTSSSGKAGALPLDLGSRESVLAAFANVEQRWGREGVEVFLTGAFTNVEQCESQPERCYALNAAGPGYVAERCSELGYGLTYFSSEYVFGQAEYEGGAVGPFLETDRPAPTSVYGAAKLEGEDNVIAVLGENALIVRTTMVFSWDSTGMNFLMQYLRQAEGWKPGGKVFSIPEDQISTPAYAPALAEATVSLRERGVGGIVNLVGEDTLSRWELVQRVLDSFGLTGAAAAFRPVKTSELHQIARRPLTAGLYSAKAKRLGLEVWSLSRAFADVKRRRAQSS